MYWSERITLFIFDQVEVTTSLLFLRTAGAEVHGESTGPTAAVPFPGSGRATAALRAAAAAADQPGPSSGQGHAYPHTFVQVPYWYDGTYLIMLIQLIPVPDLSLDLNSRRPVLWSRSREKGGSSTADFTLPYLLFTKCYEIQYHLTKTHISQHADYTKR